MNEMSTIDLAQRVHDLRRDTDPDHDRVSCWCCCTDCDFEYGEVVLRENDILDLEYLA